ncbi:hypothetical protein Ancab_025626 [Ancistrocladus abbreviatus]
MQKQTTMESVINHTLLCLLLLLSFSILPFPWSSSAQPTSPSPSPSSSSVYNYFLQCLKNQSNEQEDSVSTILFSPTNADFSSILDAYIRNERFTSPTTRKPLLIITPTAKPHISAAVVCSKSINLQIKIRSGGHDYEGLSYISDRPFIILDMFNLREVSVDIPSQTAYVEAGATLGELYYGIWNKSKVHGFPAGVCPTVGVGGHVSGGGYGNMLRRYGLSVDHVIDAEIVDVNGRILDRKSMGEDLFWAIRGGGGASFGVVVSFTVNLVAVPETVTAFRIERFLTDNATDLVYKWQTVMQDIDDDLFIRLLLQPVTDKTKKGSLTVRVTFISLFLGDSDRLVSVMSSAFPELGANKSDCQEMGWAESVLFWSNYDNGTPVEVLLNRTYDSGYLKRKSDYVQDPIPKEGLELLWQKLIELGKPGLVFNSYGGKMNQIPACATAFPHRAGNLYKIQYSTTWNVAGEAAESEYLGKIRELYSFMTPYVSKNPRGAYLNYRDLDIGVNHNGTYEEGKVYGQKYFLGNFNRLVKVKSMVDPDNFFQNEQSIPILDS